MREISTAQTRLRDATTVPGIACHLAHARDLARGLVQALDFAIARDLDFGRELDLGRDIDIARDLDLDLDVALDPVRDRALDLDRLRDLVRDRARARDLDLSLARDRYLHLVRQLATAPVDVSGADLSSEDFGDLDVLEDVIWTPETTWPPGVAGRLLWRSREIRPGVYQVRGHGERDPLSLVTVV